MTGPGGHARIPDRPGAVPVPDDPAAKGVGGSTGSTASHEDQSVGRVISKLLRIGVITSLAVVVTGLVVAYVQHPAYRSSETLRRRVLAGQTRFPHSFASLASGLAHGRGTAIVVAGLLILLFTPIARVAVSVVAFVTRRDRVFVGITCFVLAVLVLSFLLGQAGTK